MVEKKVTLKVRLWLGLAGLLLLFVDLATKQLMMVNHRTIMNFGGVFGLLPSGWWGIVLVGFWIMIFYEWLKTELLVQSAGLMLIVVGGAGNIIDRLVYGGVRDFIYYPVVNLYGNVADIYLAAGVVVLMAGYLASRKDKNETK